MTDRLFPVPSDLDIAQAATVQPIVDIAAQIGLTPDDLIMYGSTKAKVHLDTLPKLANRPTGKYIDVTAITPNLRETENAIRNIKITSKFGNRLNINNDRLKTKDEINRAGLELLLFLNF